MLNKKGSEEKLPSAGGGMLYNNKKNYEQRYRSHIRGQDGPGMIRNQSKPTLELPAIHNSMIKNE